MKRVTAGDASIPAVGFGTWQTSHRECYRAVSAALGAGYRLVDTAELYGNEEAVGEAIADADVDRDEVFLTTKLAPQSAYDYASTREAARGCLDRLGTDYVDLLLLHWPNPVTSLEDQIDAMNDLREKGLVRHLGMSNFSRRRLARARDLSDAPIVTNQVQFHPYLPQRELLRYCQDNDVALTAYSPLGHGGVLHDDLLERIGHRHGKSPAQVAIRWAIQHRNVCAIPKSTNPEHIRQNIDVFDFSLTEGEMDRIARKSYIRTGVSWARGRLGI